MRHVEEGKTPLEAALLGSREVGFTILSMTISLIAVFIPILAMGGLIGRIFREFAVTITVALIASGVVSLTVTPMLCGWLIRGERKAEHGRFHRWSEHVFTRMTQGYEHLLNLALRRQGLTMLSFMATLVVTMGLYVALPRGSSRRSIPVSCWARCAARPISPSMPFPSG
jgi:multidrug efflux pump subunit AcrB